MSRRWLPLVAILIVAACQKPENRAQMDVRMQAEADAAKPQISAQATAYGQHLTANHADTLVAYFTDDAVIMPPNAPAVSGKSAIDAWMKANPMQAGASIAITTVSVTGNGPLMVERGTYAFTMPAQGRTPAVNATGKYLNQLRREDSRWKIVTQMWSGDAPEPPMPSAPAPRHN